MGWWGASWCKIYHMSSGLTFKLRNICSLNLQGRCRKIKNDACQISWHELLLMEYRSIIMVGLFCYNQSGVNELLIMRDSHHLIMVWCVLNQLSPRSSKFLAVEKASARRPLHSCHQCLYLYFRHWSSSPDQLILTTRGQRFHSHSLYCRI